MDVASSLDRASKLIVVGGACAALAGHLWLLQSGWPTVSALGVAMFAAAATLSAVDRRAVPLVLAFAYVFPVLIGLLFQTYHTSFAVLWAAALLGALTPGALRTSWHLPAPWRPPLAGWALVILTGSAIVIGREMDFYPPTLFKEHMATNSTGGGGPAFVALWILQVALGLILGILWFDWLFSVKRAEFVKWIAAPLAGSATVMAAVAVYQALRDVQFMNQTVFGGTGRASGTLFDANVCGMLAALWIGGAVLLASQAEQAEAPRRAGLRARMTHRVLRWRTVFGTAGVVLAWLAVWSTGSRTAFATAALITVFGIVALVAAWPGRRSGRACLTAGTAVGVFVLLILIALVASAELTVVGPLRRIAAMVPDWSSDSIRKLATSLWSRDGYGTTSVAMIREYPWFGVGIGFFHSLVPDSAVTLLGNQLPPDNAQNWFRHQLAELGVVGSLPWIAWVVSFTLFALRRLRDGPAVLWVARGTLIAFALTSLVGMPSQDVAVTITFWTMAFWFVSLANSRLASVSSLQSPVPSPQSPVAGPQSPVPSLQSPVPSLQSPVPSLQSPVAGPQSMERPPGVRAWVAIAAVVGTFALGTAFEATSRLRPATRAQAFGWPYTYGFYAPEPDGVGGERRWTERRAVAVIQAPTRWIELTVSANYANYVTRPVRARVWRDREVVIDATFTTPKPVTKYIRVPDNERWVVLESWASRTLRPRRLGVADDRELGLLIQWRFVGPGN